jgi:hypothetical protein
MSKLITEAYLVQTIQRAVSDLSLGLLGREQRVIGYLSHVLELYEQQQRQPETDEATLRRLLDQCATVPHKTPDD